METSLTINDNQKRLINKTINAVEVVDDYLARIKKYNLQINSFITVTEEKAYEDARRVDKIITNLGKNALQQYPLLGTVVSYKDLFLTKGIRTTAGSKVLEDYVPPYSASVVDKLQKAGCIMIGKTNCDAWAHGASGENSDFGVTKNPWNIDYVPGGSSSGSAVAVASAFSLVATGTDTGGSIRQPANFCGVVGFKPSYGTVSRYGVIAMASSLDSIGHFTQTVEDSEKVFSVTYGQDYNDSNFYSKKIDKPKEKLKIGIPKEYFVEGIDKEIEKSVLKSIKEFKKAGFELIDVSLPHTKYAISVYYIIQPAEVSSNLGRYDGIRFGNERSDFGAEAKRRIMLGTYVLSAGYYDAYYLQASKVRLKIIEDFNKVFEQVDAIIAPVSPSLPFKFGEKSNNPLQMYLADILTVAANISGIPGIAIPSGFSKQGLPLGFQLLGQKGSEETLFSLGKFYQKITNWKPKVAL